MEEFWTNWAAREARNQYLVSPSGLAKPMQIRKRATAR